MSFVAWLQGFLRSIKLWVTVLPWERGLRIRLGKHVKLLGPGIHFKLIWVDSVVIMNVRLRISSIPIQTVTSKDGKTVTIGAGLQYQIEDIERVYNTVHNPEGTIAQMVSGILCDTVRSLNAAEVTSTALEAAILAELDFAEFGLGKVEVRITDIAFVRTYRLIQDSRWVSGDSLELSSRQG